MSTVAGAGVVVAGDGSERGLAAVRIAAAGGPRRTPQPTDRKLFEAIEKRHTHRSLFGPRPVLYTVLARLRYDAEQAGAALPVVRDEARQRVAALIARGDRQRLADRAFRTEPASWGGCNYARQRDGMPGYAVWMPGLAWLIGPLVMHMVDTGKRHAAKDERLTRTAPALLLRSGYASSHTRLTTRRLVADVLNDSPPRPDDAASAPGAS